MTTSTMTKEEALAALEERKANRPKQVDNREGYAGSPMYFYCYTCGHQSDILPESYTTSPNHTCPECQVLKDNEWI